MDHCVLGQIEENLEREEERECLHMDLSIFSVGVSNTTQHYEVTRGSEGKYSAGVD